MAIKSKNILTSLCTLLTAVMLCSQNFSLDGTSVAEFQNEQFVYNGKKFPSIRPYLFEELFLSDDSIKPEEKKELFDRIFFPVINKGRNVNFFSRIEPYYESILQRGDNKIFTGHVATGISCVAVHRAILFQGSLRAGYMKPLSMTKHYVDSVSVLPSLGMVSTHRRANYYYVLPHFRLNVKISPLMNAETGMATHFFGDGKRSLLLSDEHYPYPYLKFMVSLWKLRYVNLFAWHRDVQSVFADRWSDGINKFTAIHYLSWNVSKRLNLSVFEAVVSPLYDTLMRRQFMEYNYLLPVVMYRPVEFALGSSDNVLIGLNLSYKVMHDLFIYSQVAFDELFMDELQADYLNIINPDTNRNHGAWVNKQAYQIGFKYFNILGIPYLDWLSEVNAIRPYMYSHRDIQQNYTHLNQSLAHPYGANLVELYARLRYSGDKWFCNLSMSYLRTGLDSSGTNFGQDIFKPVFDAPIPGLNNIPVQYYNNTIGQGIPFNNLYVSVSVSRLLLPHNNIWCQLSYSFHRKKIQNIPVRTSYFHFSIKYGIAIDRKGV